MHIKRPIVSNEIAAFLVAAYFVAVLNTAFWRRLFGAVQPDTPYEWLFLGIVAIVLWLLTSLMFGALAIDYLFKPIAIVTILVSAAAQYFMAEYGTVIDAGMIINVLQTDRAEAGDLTTHRFMLHLTALGLIPSLLLGITRLKRRPILQELRYKLISGCATAVICAGLAYPFMMNLTSVFREHSILKHEVLPFNIIDSLHRAWTMHRRREVPKSIMTFGIDAKRGPTWGLRGSKSVTVLVVGETARAQSFSLNGYHRDTNPQLQSINEVVSFTDVASCGTATAQSLPCMFSGVGQAYSRTTIATEQEGLLDVLKRAGLSVWWRDNQSGCKGVCARVPTESVMTPEPRKFYELAISYDDKLLAGLQDWIDRLDGHGVIVLHMMGSHGPSYYKRYPPAHERFAPACWEAQFSRCNRDEIVNAYDNSILYSDHVLSELIKILAGNDRGGTPTAMIYVSDHGESLGENGFYLHGMPYALAPIEQKRVPWVWWLSPKFQAISGVTTDCLRRGAKESRSHDNLFHSVLGLLDVQTIVYDRNLDVTAGCRPAG